MKNQKVILANELMNGLSLRVNLRNSIILRCAFLYPGFLTFALKSWSFGWGVTLVFVIELLYYLIFYKKMVLTRDPYWENLVYPLSTGPLPITIGAIFFFLSAKTGAQYFAILYAIIYLLIEIRANYYFPKIKVEKVLEQVKREHTFEPSSDQINTFLYKDFIFESPSYYGARGEHWEKFIYMFITIVMLVVAPIGGIATFTTGAKDSSFASLAISVGMMAIAILVFNIPLGYRVKKALLEMKERGEF